MCVSERDLHRNAAVAMYLLRSLSLHANISAGIRAIANLDDCKTGFEPRIALLYLYNLISDLFSN